MIGLLLGLSSDGQAGTFLDDFNDGSTDRWLSAPDPNGIYGDWGVEEAVLVHRYGQSNSVSFLVKDLVLSHQVIEAEVSTGDYAGVVFWYQARPAGIANYTAATYNNSRRQIILSWHIDGVDYEYAYGYYYPAGVWFDLKVVANSTTKELAIYVNDTHLFSYQTNTPYSSGLSGVISGNGTGYFDNFRLTSDDIPPIAITIDIKLESYLNSINLKSKGVVPVIILTTEEFDATKVDPTTVRFADASPIKRTIEDVDYDGDLDMLLHFQTQELYLHENSTEATLTGMTDDGVEIMGTCSVNIVPKGEK
jgi:hypothetical protein